MTAPKRRRGDDGISRLKPCLEALKSALCGRVSSFFIRTLCRVFEEFSRCLECGLAVACYALLKLMLETAVQHAYYDLIGVSDEEALKRITKRSRGAASFRATMIKGLKGVHGSRKNWMLKLYLALSEFTHPSDRLHKGFPQLNEDLVLEVFDAILYLYALRGIDVASAAKSCGSEKTLKLLQRRRES